MHRFYDPVGSLSSSRITPLTVLPSDVDNRVGTPTDTFRGSITGLRAPLANASLRPYGTPTHGSGPP